MRNIKFDESLVLREYMRIAEEKGFLKTAEPQAQPRDLPAPEPVIPKPAPPDMPRTMPPISPKQDAGSVVKPGIPPAYMTELQRLNSMWLQLKDKPEAYKHYIQEMNKSIKILGTKLGNIPNVQNLLDKFKQQAITLVPEEYRKSRMASTRRQLDKTADSKLYDVSGETGKDLINSAHPGGGTKTEVSNSKTKENLVETIFEQQERDIAVVKKHPKGTYALLLGLYNTLLKKGYKEELKELKETLRKMSTPENILPILTQELFDLGFEKEAREFEELYKKAQTKEELEKQLSNLNSAAGQRFLVQFADNANDHTEGSMLSRFADAIQKELGGQGLFETYNKIIKDVIPNAEKKYKLHPTYIPRLQGALTKALGAVDKEATQLASLRSQLNKLTTTEDPGHAKIVDKKKDTTEIIKRWQKRLNLPQTGTWDKATDEAYKAYKAKKTPASPDGQAEEMEKRLGPDTKVGPMTRVNFGGASPELIHRLADYVVENELKLKISDLTQITKNNLYNIAEKEAAKVINPEFTPEQNKEIILDHFVDYFTKPEVKQIFGK